MKLLTNGVRRVLMRRRLIIPIALMVLGAFSWGYGYLNLQSYFAGPAYRVEIPEDIAVGWDFSVNFTDMRIWLIFQERPPERTMLDILYHFKRGTGPRSVGNETFAVLLPFNATVIGGEDWKVERLRKGAGGTLAYKRIYVGENSRDVFEGGITVFLNQSIWYNYRGVYSAAVKFGVGSAGLQSLMRDCGVFVNTMQHAEYRIFIEIPSIINLQTIPVGHITMSPHRNPSVLWETSWLESVIVSYTDLKEAESYQVYLFYAALYIGVGVSLFAIGLVEFRRDLVGR